MCIRDRIRIFSLNVAVAISVLTGAGLWALGYRRLTRDPVPAVPTANRLSPIAYLFPLHPSDDFLAHVLRRLLVPIEMHRVARAPLRARPEVCRGPEHFRQWH